MLKIDEETHARFMRYKSKLHAETGKTKTVPQVLNDMLDAVGAEPGKAA